MKHWLIGPLVAGLMMAMLPDDADARRFGGGRSFGMQRSAPAKPAPAQNTQKTQDTQNAQGTQATPTNAAAAAPGAAAAAAPKRSWMGPLAGVAAGLGLMALASHLGFGEGLANVMLLALLAIAAFVVIRLLMRRFAGAGPRPAFAGMPGNGSDTPPPMARASLPSVTIGSALGSTGGSTGRSTAGSTAHAAADSGSGQVNTLPADFDRDGFGRIAKMIFIRMQAANDSADLNDLRSFTTPELFAAVRLDLQERGEASQHTDVERVDAEVLAFEQDAEQQIVSVRYQGRIREDGAAEAQAFDEVWHLVKPVDDSRNWAIAGIQQQA